MRRFAKRLEMQNLQRAPVSQSGCKDRDKFANSGCFSDKSSFPTPFFAFSVHPSVHGQHWESAVRCYLRISCDNYVILLRIFRFLFLMLSMLRTKILSLLQQNQPMVLAEDEGYRQKE